MVAAGSITVAVRVRPPTSWEASRLPEPCYDTAIRGDGALSTPGRSNTTNAPLRDIVQVVDDRILTFDPDEKDRNRSFMERGFMPPGSKRYKDKRFMFDKVFGHEAAQRDVFEATSRPLLDGVLNGFNATVFAYGATGCGKTHTISGTPSDPGIIYMTMADLFQRIDDKKDEWDVEVMVTFLEIYNEEIRDLLAEPGSPTPRGGLAIREDKSVKVVGLVELKPSSAEEVKAIVLQGNERRTQSPTNANETSSRSHAVLQVHVTQSSRTASLTEEKTMATLSIIDLAGSERAAATTNMGKRMVEGANINKSLLALGNCINALCESGGAVRHVPYRNSKLTRLLKFSLGGNCKTVMIVCVAPTSAHFDDTHNTLVYAERATKIKTRVVTRNVVNVDRHVGRYVEAINRLNLEVAELKAKLAGKASAENEVVRRKKAEALSEVQRAKSDMQAKAEQTRVSIIDGAACAARISAANTKLDAIRSRLAEIQAQATSAPLSADLEAERGLLEALAAPEMQATRPDSLLNTQLQRSTNASNMFEATLRAVSERRSGRLDDASIENVKVDADRRRAEIECARAEAERDAIRSTLEAQAAVVVNLVGLVGRCTVMMGDAEKTLRSALEDGRDGLDGTLRALASNMARVADGNNSAFKALLGHETAEYVPPNRGSALDSFTRHAVVHTKPTGLSASMSSAPVTAPARSSRRASSIGSVGSPGRKSLRSPRKSLRSSMAGQPMRRVSDRQKEKKSVQWRDEAGQGNIDDRSRIIASTSAISTPPASSDSPVKIAVTPSESISAPPSGRTPTSYAGSESDWEDEKTDENVNTSYSLGTVREPYQRRARSSRLEPGFLKAKTRGGGTMLGSLAEADDESSASPERPPPLGDRSMNRIMPELHVPKRSERRAGSPVRRGPTTPRVAGASGKARRRSGIGPVRSEKGRRRSSLLALPEPAPEGSSSGDEGARAPGARRVAVAYGSPAKRPRRMSLMSKGSLRAKPVVVPAPALSAGLAPSNTSANLSVLDPNVSGEALSARGGSKPTWR